MMKRNGFVFMETIVVVCALTSTLLMLYSSYAYILKTTREINRYDTTEMIYRTYEVDKILSQVATSSVNFVKNRPSCCTVSDLGSSNYAYTCDIANKQTECGVGILSNILEVDKIYYLNPSQLYSASNKTTILRTNFDATTIKYLDQIKTQNKNLLVVKYVKKYNQDKLDKYEVFHASMEV